MNFVDGLDGLAGGVVAIGALSFFLFCYQLTRINDLPRATTAALLSAALAGACIGFLVHNFHPARIFMGDSGSMLIGLVFSASVVTLSGQIPPGAMGPSAASSLLPTLLPILLPIFILVVPLMDLFMAVVRRGWVGLRSPFSPDKLHLHHRLLEIGHSHRRAVLIMWLWAGALLPRHRADQPLPGQHSGLGLPGRDGAGHDRAHLPHPDHPQAPDRGPAGLLTGPFSHPVSVPPRLCASFHKHRQGR